MNTAFVLLEDPLSFRIVVATRLLTEVPRNVDVVDISFVSLEDALSFRQ